MDIKLTGLEDQLREYQALSEAGEKNFGNAVRLTTNAVHREARKRMRGPKSGRTYKRKRKDHQASAPNEAPAIDSRRTYRSIFKRLQGLGGEVGSAEEVAIWLEFGALRSGGNLMQRRPWLRPAVRGQRKTWYRRLRRALRQSVRAAKAGRK